MTRLSTIKRTFLTDRSLCAFMPPRYREACSTSCSRVGSGSDRCCATGDGGRVPLVPRYHVDLVDLDLAPKDHRRELGGEPAAQLLGHELHVGLAQVQLPGDLPVREVQAHQVEAQDPDPQRLVVPGQDRAGQVVEAGAACRAAVALAARSGVVPAVAGHGGAVAGRAADALGPAMLADQLVAFRVIDQRRQVHQGRGHGRHRSKRADPFSTPVALVSALGPTTLKLDKSLVRKRLPIIRARVGSSSPARTPHPRPAPGRNRRAVTNRPLFLKDIPFALLVGTLLAALLATSVLMFALPD